MSRLKHISILPILIIIFMEIDLHPKIYKRIDSDGSVIYYNKDAGSQGHHKTKSLKSRFDPIINRMSREENLDPYLIKCIIKVESNFQPDAVSVAGAMGLMQLMQATARLYNVDDPLNPEENLKAGIKHFNSLMKYFNSDIPLALAAYHAGRGRVSKNMAVPPIKSTINYVNRIMFLYNGTRKNSDKVKRLYKRIDRDGTILIYSR